MHGACVQLKVLIATALGGIMGLHNPVAYFLALSLVGPHQLSFNSTCWIGTGGSHWERAVSLAGKLSGYYSCIFCSYNIIVTKKFEMMCMQKQKANVELWWIMIHGILSKQLPITTSWYPFVPFPVVHCCHWSEREETLVVTSHWWSRTLLRHQVHTKHPQNVHYVYTWNIIH